MLYSKHSQLHDDQGNILTSIKHTGGDVLALLLSFFNFVASIVVGSLVRPLEIGRQLAPNALACHPLHPHNPLTPLPWRRAGAAVVYKASQSKGETSDARFAF